MDSIPPFPADASTQDLLVVDFLKLANRDEAEEELLWAAATQFGFW